MARPGTTPPRSDRPKSGPPWPRSCGGTGYALTDAGKAIRAKIAEHVDVTRRRLVDGVAREEYVATVEVLQRMAANLEAH